MLIIKRKGDFIQEIFVIIKTGYEGIDELLFLLFATTDKSIIAKTIVKLREKAIKEEIQHRKMLNKEWDKEGSLGLTIPEELTEEEKQQIRDFFCVQKWNGKEFDCACAEFDVSPSKLMLR